MTISIQRKKKKKKAKTDPNEVERGYPAVEVCYFNTAWKHHEFCNVVQAHLKYTLVDFILFTNVIFFKNSKKYCSFVKRFSNFKGKFAKHKNFLIIRKNICKKLFGGGGIFPFANEKFAFWRCISKWTCGNVIRTAHFIKAKILENYDVFYAQSCSDAKRKDNKVKT